MTGEGSPRQHPGPILLCAGTDPAAAARLAARAAAVLADRPCVVLATWRPLALTGVDSLADALFDTDADLRDAARHAAMRTANAAADALGAAGLHVTRQVCPEEQSPWQEILGLADRIDAGVVVAATTEHPAAGPGSLGTSARALAHRSHRPLLLVPAHADPPSGADDPLLVAYDGSPAAEHAVAVASVLLRRRPAIAATAWSTPSRVAAAAMLAVPDEVVRKGATALDEAARIHATGRASAAAARFTAAGWSCEATALQASRGAAATIVDAADERHAAVVVTGSRGRSRLAAALLGSTAEAILRHAGRPVLLVGPEAQERA